MTKLPEEIVQGWLALIPLKRSGSPDDVAGVVRWLCSHEAGYITGQVVNIDGGMVM